MKIPVFKEYLSEEQVQAGLLDKTLTQGVIRVNQRNFEQCFVDNPDGEELGDLLVLGFEDRNRALHGDLVAIRVKPRESWFLNEIQCKRHNVKCIPRAPPPAALVASPSKVVATEGSGGSSPPSAKHKSKKDQQQPKQQLIQPPLKSLQNHRRVADLCGEDLQRVGTHLFTKTAEVVAIVEQRASRKMVGHLKPMPGTVNFIMFSPPDSRIPRLLIPANNAPKGFNDRPQDFERYIYLVELAHWRTDSRLPVGKLLDKLGLAGDIEAEHKGLLLVNGVDLRDYDEHPELTECLPLPKVPGEWRIDEEELGRRRDFRDDVVFTIDPLTARDLDDALHIKQICRKKDDGRDGGMCWEVGVHIADVSYFLRQDTELDDWACKRGTSVYLVHQVIPMLPRILCEELCSLNPGVDRLTFSVVWHMDDDANIFHTTFCRSIIRSCAKLAYEHAQDIIDNPTKQFAIAEMPPIHCGRKIRDIKQAVRNLDAIARKLKAKRFGKGALKLELPKLRFDVEKSSTGIWQPRGIRLDERKDANFLVEEFMLLANMYVAHQTYDYFKTSALLRRHPPPKKKELKNLVDKCGKLGIHINPLSSKTLADSLKTYEHMEECKYGVMPALNQMLMKCMHLAQYFCTGLAESEHEFRHYALSVDFYTHFTSPIRRYPDVIVHRLLAASLGYCPSPGYSTDAINKIAGRANNTKTSAKVCSELSGEIFFGAIVRGSGGNFEAIAVVMSIYDGCFDVLLLKYAIIKRVYLKKQKEVVRTYFGKLGRDGPVTLVLLLKDEADEDAATAAVGGASATKDGSAVAAARDDVEYVVGGDDADEYDGLEVDDEPEMGRDGAAAVVVAADGDQQLDVPGWVSSSRAEQRQTLNMMSIVQVRLVPIKDSVKYEVNLVPTPDARSLSWHDAREHMEV
uniref:Ribonuclease II/R domain-containing protein n=1 Tax=Globodera rostochiensis TaxID=31243 RepID=A0A914H3D2_GLORO